jgi:hypothetical protein
MYATLTVFQTIASQIAAKLKYGPGNWYFLLINHAQLCEDEDNVKKILNFKFRQQYAVVAFLNKKIRVHIQRAKAINTVFPPVQLTSRYFIIKLETTAKIDLLITKLPSCTQN